MNQIVGLRILSLLNCQAKLAENGQMCLDMLKVSEYDVILMDCQMPVLGKSKDASLPSPMLTSCTAKTGLRPLSIYAKQRSSVRRGDASPSLP